MATDREEEERRTMANGRGGKQLQWAFVVIFFCTFLNLLFYYNYNQFSADFLDDQDPEQEDGGGRRMRARERFPPTEERRREVSADESGEDFSRIFNASCPTDYLGITDYAKRICEGESPEVCRLLSCRNLLTGSGGDLYFGRARQLMKRRPRKSLPDRIFRNLTADCAVFRRASGFQLSPTDADEQSFPIAFNILAHSNAEQVLRLVRALYRPQNVFCIHVDAKAPADLIDAVKGIARCFDNIRLASKLERIVYAEYSRLQADINCMKDNMESKSRWKYLINTAAQAYPLRSVGEIIRILRIYNGANDVEGLYGRDVIRIRYEREWGVEGGQIAEVGRAHSKPPHNIDIVRGSAYGVFSRAFVRFVLEDRRAIDLLNWSRKTFSPDEHYWATLHHTYSNPHLHTPGGFSGYPNNKTWLAVYANWDRDSCRGAWIHGVCVFGLGDLPSLVERPELFANKFRQDLEPLALDCLEAWIRHKDHCPVPFQEQFYRSLEFIRKP